LRSPLETAIQKNRAEISDRMDRSDAITVRFRSDMFDVPILAPMDYLLGQLRQAIAKIRESDISPFDYPLLGSVLGKMKRTDTDPVYKPLHPVGVIT